MISDRSITVLFMAVITVLAATAPAATVAGSAMDNSSDVTLTVTVADRFNSQIGGVTVTAEWDGGSTSGQTASNGMVLLDVPAGADVTLSIDHHAYTRNSPVVVENAQGQEVDITIYSKANGEVKVIEDNTPLRNAQVMFYQGSELVTHDRTDSDGLVDSGTIERGDYQIVAVKEGYFLNQTTVHIADTTEVTLALEEGDVQLQVNVRDDHFTPAEAVGEAEVEIDTVGTVLTRSNGQQTVVVPVNSEIEITATKGDYTSTTTTVSVGETDTSVDVLITREDALNISVSNQRVVSGENVRVEVTDEYEDEVEGATILVNGEAAGTTDADGVARVTLEGDGTVTISAQDAGVTSEEITVEVLGDGDGEPVEAVQDDTEPEEEALPVPGFGLLAALLALVGAIAFTRRLS